MTNPDVANVTKGVMSRAVVLCATFCLLLGAAIAPGATWAADTYHCNQIVSPGTPCPGYYGGPRHTYTNERSSWSTSIDYNCGVYLYQAMVHDANPMIDPPPGVKYSREGYCYLNHQFPNNTQLLRGYTLNGHSSPWWFVGVGGW